MRYEPLINRSYFQGPLTIGQSDSDAVADELQLFIEDYEPQFLLKLMGRTLYDAFYEGMRGEDPDQRWIKLSRGASFTFDPGLSGYGGGGCTQQVEFYGLLSEGFSNPIASYVFYWWERFHQVATGGLGKSVQQVVNGVRTNDAHAISAIWNQMGTVILAFYLFIDMNRADYPEFDLPHDQWWFPGIMDPFNIVF